MIMSYHTFKMLNEVKLKSTLSKLKSTQRRNITWPVADPGIWNGGGGLLPSRPFPRPSPPSSFLSLLIPSLSPPSP